MYAGDAGLRSDTYNASSHYSTNKVFHNLKLSDFYAFGNIIYPQRGQVM